jgi:hypothetical protein
MSAVRAGARFVFVKSTFCIVARADETINRRLQSDTLLNQSAVQSQQLVRSQEIYTLFFT